MAADSSTDDRKRILRSELRALRRTLPDRAARSRSIWSQVEALDAFARARTVMVYRSVAGEPETSEAIDGWQAEGRTVVLPEDVPPPDPGAVDLVIVPGVAYTRRGERLGQGGGWYDRFLPLVSAPTVGVCFRECLVDEVPVADHDRSVDVVITDRPTGGGPSGGGVGYSPS